MINTWSIDSGHYVTARATDLFNMGAGIHGDRTQYMNTIPSLKVYTRLVLPSSGYASPFVCIK